MTISRIFTTLAGIVPGLLMAVYFYSSLLEPNLELAALIPIFGMIFFGLGLFLLGGIIVVVAYLVRKHVSFFGVGLALGGLALLATFFYADYALF